MWKATSKSSTTYGLHYSVTFLGGAPHSGKGLLLTLYSGITLGRTQGCWEPNHMHMDQAICEASATSVLSLSSLYTNFFVFF